MVMGFFENGLKYVFSGLFDSHILNSTRFSKVDWTPFLINPTLTRCHKSNSSYFFRYPLLISFIAPKAASIAEVG